MVKKPSEVTRAQFEGILWVGRAYGVYNFDGTDINARIVFVLIMGLLEQAMHIHSLRESWPNIAGICNLVAIYCLVIQLLTRLGSKFINKDEETLPAVMNNVAAFYEREEKIHAHSAVLANNFNFFKILLNTYLTGCFILFISINPIAWILSYYTNDFILFTPLHLPFTVINTLTFYIINAVLLTFYTMLVYVCFMAADVVFMYFVLQCIPMVEIYCLKLRKFKDELGKLRMESPLIVQQLSTSKTAPNAPLNFLKQLANEERAKEIEKFEKQQLIGLIKELKSYDQYVQTIIQFVKFTIFAATSLNSMAIGMIIVVMMNYSKVIGIGVLIFLTNQVLVPCVQGTFIAHQKNKLQEELFAFPWYELAVSNQKMFLQLIHMCQNLNEFRIPLIGDVNMSLFTNIVNGARSYFIYLWNFT